ncbi:MAG: 3-hydroxyacyl-CoA dehydrogenase/enoyl-CoA hydratase/3-hydroxybutyryl-CoA epimerase [Lentimonas sp.]|jgi:3-hydroxyacyl-CoA dehydrogenase/enoyl-CoA hydratase/3-hydroxybutyryl-CoA epimerase
MSKLLNCVIDSNGVATIVFDLPGQKVNKLSSPVLLELEKILNGVAVNDKIHLLIFKSAKEGIFIAGADINEIKNIKDESDAYLKATSGQRILSQIANLKIPTVAIINGACLGGGLELALACNYRIAIDNPKTILGLPEVKLGIIPGFGGTQRLPRLIGLQESFKMILSGGVVDFKKAFRIGLVDKVIREEFLENQLDRFIVDVVLFRRNRNVLEERSLIRKKRFIAEVLLVGKYLIYHFVKKSLILKTKGKYPAPLAAFDVIKRTYHCSDYELGLQIEAEEFSKLAGSKISKNLIELFFTGEQIKKDVGSESDSKPLEIKKVGLLGAGIMGGGIAWLFSNSDILVRMKDISQGAIALGFKQVLKIYQQLKKIGKYKDNQISCKMDEISSTTDFSGFDNVDLVVEAIIENMEIKKEAFSELETHVNDEAIIASNTSSLSITEMAKSLKNPQRFVGMHFFNPVNRMPLVEVIKGDKTSDETVATIVALAKKLKKTPIVVKDVPGFLVNRILLPYINEAGFMLEEGAEIKNIDSLVANFGMPMGPFILADEVGIDVGYKVAKSLNEGYGERMKVSNLLIKISKNKNLLGKKSKQGFYRYSKDGKNLGINPKINEIIFDLKKAFEARNNGAELFISNNDIVHRCILMMVNEASKCLEEGVVKNANYLDMAMIMGTGFPAFTGGVLRYADEIGVDYVVSRLREFERAYGIRFSPSELLVEMAKKKRSFYEANK